MITLLNGVTATGVGALKQVGPFMPGRLAPSNFSIVITYTTAAPTAATLVLQGTHDGTNWVDLGNSVDVSATVVGFGVLGKPFLKVRGNLTVYTAGSCTGITATVEVG